MIPIKWTIHRVAAGSYLVRNPDVNEGHHFYPPKLEVFLKDGSSKKTSSREVSGLLAFICFYPSAK